MRQKHWVSLYLGLTESVSLRAATEQFAALQSEPVIAQFESLAALHAYLKSRPKNLDERDQVFAGIIRVLQRRTSAAQLAYTLLWCGLWPGLDHVYQRRLPAFSTEPEELIAEICSAFARVVAETNLQRVHRVAATLVRNVDREVAAGARRRREDEARRAVAAEATGDGPERPSVAGLGVPPAFRMAGEFAAWRVRLGLRVGASLDLFRLSHESASRRIRRAIARVLRGP